MSPTKKPTGRRTFAEIAAISHDDVKSELLAVGLKPLELVPYVEHFGPGPDPRPRLEPHQRYDWSEHDRLWRADDPFCIEYQKQQRKKEPSPFDAVTSDHWTLYGVELDRYVNTLALSTITKKLETIGKETGRTPQRHWTENEYRHELGARMTQQDQDEFVASPQPRVTKKKGTK